MRYAVRLSCEPSTSFYCAKAANSMDIDIAEKLKHELIIDADLTTPYNVGLIIGSSGSGKTTLAKQIFGDEIVLSCIDQAKTVIDQMPDDMSYEDRCSILTGVGLSQVPCWIRPVYTLSNGQKFRAEVAIQSAKDTEIIVIDEWTSVVDRTVAKAMSNSIQKYIRKTGKKIVLLSCHADIVEWLQPDWIIDCNKSEYSDRRLVRQSRTECLNFEIKRCERSSWKNFSRYHYLSSNLAGGENHYFGLYFNEEQIGFQCFSNYVPHRDKKTKKIMHFNRTVIHPDYVGLGMGVKFINETCHIMQENGYRVMAKFSSPPVYKSLIKYPNLWKLLKIDRIIKTTIGGSMDRKSGFREKVKTYSFEFIGDRNNE